MSTTALLLGCNGTNGGTTLTDEGAYSSSWTITGDPVLDTTGPKYGTASLKYTGGANGAYAYCSNTSVHNIPAGDFCIEMYFKSTQTGRANATLLAKGSGGFGAGSWSIMYDGNSANGKPTLYWADYSTGAPLIQSSTGGYSDGNWHHIAWIRIGTNHYLMLDGVQRGTVSTSAVVAALTANLILGNDVIWTPRGFIGHIDGVRITYGSGVYNPAGFTPGAYELTFSSTITSSQGETSDITAAETFASTLTSSQGETSSLSASEIFASTLSSGQAETSSLTAAEEFSGGLTSSQGQTSDLVGELIQDIFGDLSSGQGQTSSITLEESFVGDLTSGQASQTDSIAGLVGNVISSSNITIGQTSAGVAMMYFIVEKLDSSSSRKVFKDYVPRKWVIPYRPKAEKKGYQERKARR